MMPGMNPGQMKKLMKMMKAQGLDVDELIFLMKDGSKKVIREPEVTKMNVMGNEMYQVQGNLEDYEEEPEINEDDIQVVMVQAGVDKEAAKKALEQAEGDIAKAIMSLK